MLRAAPHRDAENVVTAYSIFCPACKRLHTQFFRPYGEPGKQWVFNGSLTHPTFTPSILCKLGPYPEDWGDGKVAGSVDICHSYVTDGKIQFLTDCTHELAGQTVELPNIE